MKQVYCDNGSTTFPKAPGLGKVVGEHIDRWGYNISRGGYAGAYSVEEKVIEARESLCRLFHFPKMRNVVFTAGATAGLNLVLKGLLSPGDHVITSALEHNAAARPLTQLAEAGVLWEEAPADPQGRTKPEAVEGLLRPETRLVLINHGSNVCGVLAPLESIGVLCRERGVFFAVDAAQTAGPIETDMEKCRIDALIFPGHKGLLGPQGVGGLILSDALAAAMRPLLAGGTGSHSDQLQPPEVLPDKFQPGTLNLPGIVGLGHALSYLEKEGPGAIREKEARLTELFLEGVLNMKGVFVPGPPARERCAVVSLDMLTMDNAQASYLLERDFGIQVRCGLHCAPRAHRALGTFPRGTVRFSFGYFNTEQELSYVLDALHKIISRG
ncbi:MAG: aminotransferase class V-fold PLP-dependent enzyme [Bacillota bacterium]|nr:aminotransferase class V-fold PLP-dependent enzyme [Bacillota bacterium]